MKRYPNNEKLTDAALHARTMRSRRVTATRRDCDCVSCLTGPRRDSTLLVRNFNYSRLPYLTQIA